MSRRVEIERRISPAASWSRRAGTFALTLLAVSVAAHRFDLIETLPLLWLLGIVGALAMAGVILAVAGLAAFWSEGAVAGRNALVGLLASAAALSPFAASAYRFAVNPQLADVSTDTVAPPDLNVARVLRRPGMNALRPISPAEAALQARSYPLVVSRRYETELEQVLETVETLAAERGWRNVGAPVDPSLPEVTLEFEASTPLIGFKNDVAIRLVAEAEGTVVDMRSASRFGRHDLGDNAARITRFLTELDSRMALLAPG
jgi:hypothetical protein